MEDAPLKCRLCGSANTTKHGYDKNVRYRHCADCGHYYSIRTITKIKTIKCIYCNSYNVKKGGGKDINNDCFNFCLDCGKYFSKSTPFHKVINGYKQCKKCNEKKSIDEFYVYTSKDKAMVRSICRKCTKEKDSWFVKYKMTFQDFLGLLEMQNHKCAICGKDISAYDHPRPFIDHCHKTNKIRGVLCRSCNLLLGFAYDNIETLKKAIFYLKKAI